MYLQPRTDIPWTATAASTSRRDPAVGHSVKEMPNHRLCTKCITTAEEEQSTAQHKVHVGTQYRTFFVAPFSFLLTRPAEAHEPGIPSQSLRSRLCTICPTKCRYAPRSGAVTVTRVEKWIKQNHVSALTHSLTHSLILPNIFYYGSRHLPSRR